MLRDIRIQRVVEHLAEPQGPPQCIGLLRHVQLLQMISELVCEVIVEKLG